MLDVVAVEERPPQGPAFQFDAPTPNPFRAPAIGLRFALSRRSPVPLAVYDVQGRLVVMLVDGELAAGWHPISWAPRNSHGVRVASAVYVARLEALGEVRVRKLVLLR